MKKRYGSKMIKTAKDELKRVANHEEQLHQFRSEGLDVLLDENEPLVDTFLGEEDPFVTRK